MRIQRTRLHRRWVGRVLRTGNVKAVEGDGDGKVNLADVLGMNDHDLEVGSNRRISRRARRARYLAKAHAVRREVTWWSWALVGGLMLIALVLLFLLRPREISVTAEGSKCGMEDSVLLSKERGRPSALAVMPYTESIFVRQKIEQITGFVTASAVCDPRLKPRYAFKHECGNPNRAIITTSAAPMRNATGESVYDTAYESVVFVPRNPFDWIYIESRRTPMANESDTMIPDNLVQELAAVYKEVFNFWFRAPTKKLMIPFEDLVNADEARWGQVAKFVGVTAPKSRLKCALEATDRHLVRPDPEDIFAGEKHVSADAKAYVSVRLAREICVTGYENSLQSKIDCDSRWLDERKLQQENQATWFSSAAMSE